MAKTVTPLTDIKIKQSKPRDKEYNLSDGGGLQLRVRPNGTKTWMFVYQVPIIKKRVWSEWQSLITVL